MPNQKTNSMPRRIQEEILQEVKRQIINQLGELWGDRVEDGVVTFNITLEADNVETLLITEADALLEEGGAS